MEREIRNLLERTTQQARGLLETDYAKQLEGTYDILSNGTIHADPGKHLTGAEERFFRSRLVAAIEHRRAQGEANQESVANFLRECAFTFLNRIVALRMLEARGIIKQSVSKAEDSAGFTNEYLLLAQGLKGLPDKGYRLFLESLFDEIGREIGVLFDRNDLAGQLWPDRPRLLELLQLLNNPDLEAAWGADETVGWVYQYFNRDDERREMRAKSSAPRNSREMAVRNQFFTPRYVVEFLTDNTLGRSWYEMRQGETSLKERCQYLTRRPNEHFLKSGETAPDARDHSGLAQEDLLREPLYVPYRASKDPREIRVLDPACGSGHFLLYCFDLLETIYEEAWDAGIGSIRIDYPRKPALLRDIPELILRHNLHGIDIDPRAAQIGSLALWMRAQRGWQQVPRSDRPTIRKTNIVIAEPMPGEPDLLDEFCAGLEPKLLGQIVREVFARMKVAGDAGALLRVDADIADLVEEVKRHWVEEESPTDRHGNQLLFAKSSQRTIFETSQVTSNFWGYAEERLFDALNRFTQTASSGAGFRKRLFAEDAERGFAFIDICRNRFDVVLMNPPFGDRPERCGDYLLQSFPATAADVYSMFFERAIGWLVPRGKVGAISNRTWLGLPTLEGLRKDIFGRSASVECAADLGSFVLEAQVETAAVVLGESTGPEYPALWVRLLKTKAKQASLKEALVQAASGSRRRGVYVSPQTRYRAMPTSVFGYWMSDRLIATYRPENSIEKKAATVKQGTATADDFRFLRLAWEVPSANIGTTSIWWRFAKGGEYSPFYDDVHLLLKWRDGGRELGAWGRGRPQNVQFFGRRGVTWPLRTTSPFGPRALPAECAFGHKGPAAFPHNGITPDLVLGVLASRPSRLLLSVRLGAGDDAPGSASKSYEVGLIRDLPFPQLEPKAVEELRAASARCSQIVQAAVSLRDESSALFLHPFVGLSSIKLPSVRDLASFRVASREERLVETAELMQRIDRLVSAGLGFSPEDDIVLNEELELPLGALPDRDQVDLHLFTVAYLEKSALPGASLPGGLEAEEDVRVLTRRKKQTAALRSEEAICRLFEIPPQKLVETRRALGLMRDEDLETTARDVLNYLIGAAFGRFNIILAIDRSGFPVVSPFAALPPVQPGSFWDAEELFPAADGATDSAQLSRSYPLGVPRDGILVLDNLALGGAHGKKVEVGGLVKEAIQFLWQETATAIEDEICRILRVENLRQYLSSGFFHHHLKTYSKSRRQAPIYWPLSVPSGEYGVWLYYDRLTSDTFWRVLNDHVKPKLAQEEHRLAGLRAEAGDVPTSDQRKAIGEQERLANELAAFRDSIEAIAPLWSPDLDDGVLLNFCPLWRLVPHHPLWQRELRDCWQQLSIGVYDWAHIAMTLWPERVVPKCRSDRSIAIAHAMEDRFWEQQADGKWTAKPVTSAEMKAVVEEKTSRPVKAALERLLSQSTSAPQARRGRNSRREA